MERVKINNIAEDCLKAFKRYVGFLNCEDYITLEEINQIARQFKRTYEVLIDLVPETPKKQAIYLDILNLLPIQSWWQQTV